ncbi:MAG TPA: efflux RND transporter periplasmic adaptor subunit [Acidobacteriaceae bacterium]|jgi:HlyD family secretion protein|nr:efflux RND transporter periplasmic adaptor subunit [Acidobacteriaceae bacterium]
MATNRATPRTARIWLLTAVAIIIIFYVVRLMTRGKLPIRVAEATMGELRSTVATNGKVEPLPENNFEAHAPFAGVVETVNVHPGEKVAAGQLLIAMDTTEATTRLAAARAALTGAQASLQSAEQGGTPEERVSLLGQLQSAKIDRDQAQHDLNALQKLQASGAASPNEVSAAEARLNADNNSIQILEQRKTARLDSAGLAHARANLQDAQAAYAAAEDALHRAVVHAPFAGTVYSLPVGPTEFVQMGDRLLSMAKVSHMEVMAYFDEPEIGNLQVGQPATVIWDAKPDQVWQGRVARLPSTIITYLNSRNVGEVLVTLDNPDGSLLPDTNVRVTVTVANESNVLIVPRDALHIEQGKTFVYRLEGDSLHRIPVVIGKLNYTDVQIVSGLKAGETVALNTTNGQPISTGVPVKVVQ